MLNKLHHLLVVLCFGAMLAACGGGGGSPGSSGSGGQTGPIPGAPPTASISNNSATATVLATEAQAALDAAQTAAAAQGISPFGLPTGFVQTTNCTVSGSLTVNAPDVPSAGATMTVAFDSCTFVAGMTIDGDLSIQFATYTNESNFTFTMTYNLSVAGDTPMTLHATQACTIAAGVATCTFNHDGRAFETTFSYAGGVVNGSYQWTYSNVGTVKFTFVNWTGTSGTIEVTGANGSSATIVRTSATTFLVTINGTPYSVTLP